jgi:hypothetical protein
MTQPPEEFPWYLCDSRGINRKVVSVNEQTGVKVLECGHESRLQTWILNEPSILIPDSVS